MNHCLNLQILYLLDTVNETNLKAVFDTGNRVIETNDLRNEILILGDYIKHIHIKDKNKNGENVILGDWIGRLQ